MYFWNTNLVEHLAKGPLKERDQKNYYLATSVFILASYYIALLGPHENPYAIAVEAIGTISATVIGLNAAFTANGGLAGIRFLEKIVAISFPLSMKILAAGLVLGLLEGTLQAGLSAFAMEWISSISIIAIQVVFLLRLITHVKRTNVTRRLG